MKDARITRSKLTGIQTTEGKTIEQQIEIMLKNGEEIGGNTPLIYTPRNEGVGAAFNPRTDRFDLALDAVGIAERSKTARKNAAMTVVKDESGEQSNQGAEAPSTVG